MLYVKTTNEELYHHGIVGQKWGTRNGPPYPLGYSKHSKAEKAAMSKDEKYRAKQVDRVSGRYVREANRYDKIEKKWASKLANHLSSTKENLNTKVTDHDSFQKRLNELNRDFKKGTKYANKADAARIGKELCNFLLEKEIGHIQTMDVSEDKKRRGKQIAKDVLASVGASAVTTIGLQALGVPAVVATYRYTKNSRLTKDDVKEAVNYAGGSEPANEREYKTVRKVIRRTTNYRG